MKCRQGADFVHLNRQHGVRVQTGGSDQWGNIVAGVAPAAHLILLRHVHATMLSLWSIAAGVLGRNTLPERLAGS